MLDFCKASNNTVKSNKNVKTKNSVTDAGIEFFTIKKLKAIVVYN